MERFSAEWWRREFEDAVDRASKLEAERDVLGDRVNSVIALHHINADGYCAECTPFDRDEGWNGPRWPCDTVRLLIGRDVSAEPAHAIASGS